MTKTMNDILGLDEAKCREIVDIKEKYIIGELTFEEAREIILQRFDSVTPQEFAFGEQMLKDDGIDDETMHEKMDDIIRLFDGVMEREHLELPEGHPIRSFMEENQIILGTIAEMKELLAGKFIKNRWLEVYDRLKEYIKHITRKHNQLFPYLEQKGFDRPTLIMWTFDDHVKKAILRSARYLDMDKEEAFLKMQPEDGEPVGSGLLANYFDMALSSATLRNEMAALTKLGLLEQPHTSAGRVPSAQGYRYYLDHLIDAPKSGNLPEKDRRRIDDLFAAMDAEPEKLVPAATRCLADMTGCAAAATTPQAPDLCIAHFEVVQVGRYSAAVLAVTSAGGVRTRVARVDTGLTRDDAANLAQLLNRGLTFVAPQDLSPMLMASMVLAAGQRLAPVIMAAQALVTTGPQACLEGAQYLAKMADVRQNLGTLLEIFSDNEAATELIHPEGNKITATLGCDLDPAMPGACIVSKRYLAGGGLTGSVALIGSTRMEYERLLPILDYFAARMGQSMAGQGQ